VALKGKLPSPVDIYKYQNFHQRRGFSV
jgi:hypothetical protein